MTINTHELFKTIDHRHIGKDLKEVLISECEDGRWFVENNWGDEDFEKFEGISNPHLSPYTNPRFFTSENEVLEYAISIVCSVIPGFTYDCEE